MKTLDKKKPFGEISNDSKGRRYEQDGVFFNADGTEWKDPDAKTGGKKEGNPGDSDLTLPPYPPTEEIMGLQRSITDAEVKMLTKRGEGKKLSKTEQAMFDAMAAEAAKDREATAANTPTGNSQVDAQLNGE